MIYKYLPKIKLTVFVFLLIVSFNSLGAVFKIFSEPYGTTIEIGRLTVSGIKNSINSVFTPECVGDYPVVRDETAVFTPAIHHISSGHCPSIITTFDVSPSNLATLHSKTIYGWSDRTACITVSLNVESYQYHHKPIYFCSATLNDEERVNDFGGNLMVDFWSMLQKLVEDKFSTINNFIGVNISEPTFITHAYPQLSDLVLGNVIAVADNVYYFNFYSKGKKSDEGGSILVTLGAGQPGAVILEQIGMLQINLPNLSSMLVVNAAYTPDCFNLDGTWKMKVPSGAETNVYPSSLVQGCRIAVDPGVNQAMPVPITSQ